MPSGVEKRKIFDHIKSSVKALPQLWEPWKPDACDPSYLIFRSTVPAGSEARSFLIFGYKDRKRVLCAGAWSIDGAFPGNYAPVMLPRNVPSKNLTASKAIDGKFMFMMSYLWTGDETEYIEYEDDDSMKRSVARWIELIREHCTPYFREQGTI